MHINRIILPMYYNLAPSISIFNLKDRKAVRSLNFNLNTKSRRVIYVFHLKHLLTVENVLKYYGYIAKVYFEDHMYRKHAGIISFFRKK